MGRTFRLSRRRRRPGFRAILIAVAVGATVTAGWLGEGWQGHLSQFGIDSSAAALASPSVRVIDADTLAYGQERIRILNLDTPESGSGAQCDTERRRAADATAHARHLIETARDIRIVREDRDTDGRTLAHISLDGEDFGRLMIRDGHARRWTGRRHSWC